MEIIRIILMCSILVVFYSVVKSAPPDREEKRFNISGNAIGFNEAEVLLSTMLESESGKDRMKAVRYLKHFGAQFAETKVPEKLINVYRSEDDPKQRTEIAIALGVLNTPKALPIFYEAIESTNDRLTFAGAVGLLRHDPEIGLNVLMALIEESSDEAVVDFSYRSLQGFLVAEGVLEGETQRRTGNAAEIVKEMLARGEIGSPERTIQRNLRRILKGAQFIGMYTGRVEFSYAEIMDLSEDRVEEDWAKEVREIRSVAGEDYSGLTVRLQEGGSLSVTTESGKEVVFDY